MIDFLKESDSFVGIAFRGQYYIQIEHFEAMYNHYLKTGENLLDDYNRVTHEIWSSRSDKACIYYEDEYEKVRNSISKIRSLGIVDADDIHDAIRSANQKISRYRNWIRHNNEDAVKRREACAYTAKASVKKAVYGKYGKKCLACGTTKKLSIDHVIPISMGGENNLDNMQPLCKPCNSRKGSNTTDYRKRLGVLNG